MTPRADSIARRLAADLEDLREFSSSSPEEADAIAVALLAHLQGWYRATTPIELTIRPAPALRATYDPDADVDDTPFGPPITRPSK